MCLFLRRDERNCRRAFIRVNGDVLLKVTTTHRPAIDLGHLLRKHPDRTHLFELSFGRAHVFYPEANGERCTVALFIEVDPVGLVRNRRGPGGEGRSLQQYVNDRPYVSSSFLSVAIADVFSSAMAGKAKERQDLIDQSIPLKAEMASVPCRGGADFLKRLFEPLGYTVSAQERLLDEKFPEWGLSPYFDVRLEGMTPLRRLLTHLYVLIPVLDNDKHYWVGDDEVEKLLRNGEGWLNAHPERELIAQRYLKHRRTLVNDALDRLAEDDPDANEREHVHEEEEQKVEEKISLNQQRLGTVLAVLKQTGAKRVVDLGCGEGRLLQGLLKEKQFEEIVGMDVSYRALEIAADRLKLDRLPALQKKRIKLIHGSLIYRDKRLAGYDAASVVEVIEHLDPPRLSAFERVLFEFAKPAHVVVTTPNAEYNVKWETLPAGRFRHKDHRFEWTRAEFQEWTNRVAEKFGYSVRLVPVGPEDSVVGAPTQMAIFNK
jgi:3' terminal RNA ribose 2'-O-methyltransferase Hen1